MPVKGVKQISSESYCCPDATDHQESLTPNKNNQEKERKEEEEKNIKNQPELSWTIHNHPDQDSYRAIKNKTKPFRPIQYFKEPSRTRNHQKQPSRTIITYQELLGTNKEKNIQESQKKQRFINSPRLIKTHQETSKTIKKHNALRNMSSHQESSRSINKH